MASAALDTWRAAHDRQFRRRVGRPAAAEAQLTGRRNSEFAELARPSAAALSLLTVVPEVDEASNGFEFPR
jgi:hypothetical protein